MPGWMQNILAVLVGGALSGAAAAASSGQWKTIGAAAGAGAVGALIHLNVDKNP